MVNSHTCNPRISHSDAGERSGHHLRSRTDWNLFRRRHLRRGTVHHHSRWAAVDVFAEICSSACRPTCSSDGTQALYSAGTSFTVTRTDLGEFTLRSLDAAVFFTASNYALDLRITSQTRFNTLLTTTINVPPGAADTFRTFSFFGFEDLLWLNISQQILSNQDLGFAIDNIVADIPEALTWAMLLSGFAILALVTRYRRRASNVRVHKNFGTSSEPIVGHVTPINANAGLLSCGGAHG